MNKEQKARDGITALYKPSPRDNELERMSKKMAKIARAHHEQL